jgi:hypothetical protein
MLLLYTCTTAALVCVWYVSTMRKAAYDFVDIRHAPPFAEDYLCTPANLVSEISSSLVVFNSDLLMVSGCRLRFLVRIHSSACLLCLRYTGRTSCGARTVASSSFLPYYLRHKLVSIQYVSLSQYSLTMPQV